MNCVLVSVPEDTFDKLNEQQFSPNFIKEIIKLCTNIRQYTRHIHLLYILSSSVASFQEISKTHINIVHRFLLSYINFDAICLLLATEFNNIVIRKWRNTILFSLLSSFHE